MRRRLAFASLAFVVLLAGCSGVVPSPSPGDGGSSSASTATAEWDGDSDNPFRERTLTVALADETATDREYAPLVRDALDYWEQNATTYAGYPIEYEFRANATDPDVRVRFVERIDSCGHDGTEFTAGCAPYITDGPVERPATVRIETGYDDPSTVLLLQHELGHTLGLAHDDRPSRVMSAQAELYTLPRPDATERLLPWASDDLTYAVSYDGVAPSERDATRRQVEAAVEYAAGGADGTIPENVTFTRVSDPERANVTIRFTDSDPCTAGDGSCGELRGLDPDGDGALETYARLSITVVGLDTEVRGWHVGYWTARGFGLRGEELPAPLRSSDPDVRRSEWWR